VQTQTIRESVGKKGKNKGVDVLKIQQMINSNNLYTGLAAPLPMTGVVDDALIGAIESFQANHPLLLIKKPDGLVSPAGKTVVQLKGHKNREGICKSYFPVGFDGNFFVRFNTDNFLKLYSLQYPTPALGADAKAGLTHLLNAIIVDTEVTNIAWAAYMLATVKLECGNTWRAIEEYGKGAGHDYGKAVSIADPTDATGKKKISNTYYGRGFVQLTWETNYQKMDTALGLSGKESLHVYPANALDSTIAYKIMSYGMRNGSFTGKKLSDYITSNATDYKNARRIINGQDKADLIKGYAEDFEFILRFCNGV
jgi:hypothetical protein